VFSTDKKFEMFETLQIVLWRIETFKSAFSGEIKKSTETSVCGSHECKLPSINLIKVTPTVLPTTLTLNPQGAVVVTHADATKIKVQKVRRFERWSEDRRTGRHKSDGLPI